MPENPGDIEYRNDLFQFVMKASAQFYSIAFFFSRISEIQALPFIPWEQAAHTKNQADLQQ